MTLQDVFIKIDLRLNKSDSSDYDNLWSYVKQEAFNKAVTEWVRRRYKGKNQTQEGDEETTSSVDDLQLLLKKVTLNFRDKDIYVETEKVPTDYLYFKRITPYVSKGNCENIRIKAQLKEEANIDSLLPQYPSFKFEETFHTLIGNKAHLYHNKDFVVAKIELTYYRKPVIYNFKKLSTLVEFKDDICEILVDKACEIIASDIESLNAKALSENRAENNT